MSKLDKFDKASSGSDPGLLTAKPIRASDGTRGSDESRKWGLGSSWGTLVIRVRGPDLTKDDPGHRQA